MFHSKNRSLFLFVFNPLLCLLFILLEGHLAPILGVSSEAIRVLAVAQWMISWWIAEIAPIGVVALFPFVLFPLLKVVDLKEISSFYAHPIIYLFMGGFMIAIGLEKSGLSLRIALSILKITGSSVAGVVRGFIIATTLLSMWISNTATTVMMIPIADSVFQFIKKNSIARKREYNYFSIALFLSIAYAANIGGIFTPIGTPPNVVLLGFLDSFNLKIEFLNWMLITIPIGVSLLFIMYFLITKFLYPFEIEVDKELQGHISKELNELGKMSEEEKVIASIFFLTCFCWVFKTPINYFLGGSYLNDTITAMMGGTLCFIAPYDFKRVKFVLGKEDIFKLPWDIILLFGGGMALAHGMSSVGLVNLITDALESFGWNSLYLIAFFLTFTSLFLTEVMSNVALCNIILPIILGYGQKIGVNPLLLGIPVALAASFAFSMPISTPPNAIVFSTGKLKMKHMFKAGILLNFISIIIIMTIGWPLLNYFS